MTVASTGFPCGTSTKTEVVCTPRFPSGAEFQLCKDALDLYGRDIKQFCADGTITVDQRLVCCDCDQTSPDACQGFKPECSDRFTWQAEQAPITLSNPPPATLDNSWFVPTTSSGGQSLLYVGPACVGDVGGPLINIRNNFAFGVAITRSSDCTSAGGLGLKRFAQFVDRGQDAGVWVGALARALVPFV